MPVPSPTPIFRIVHIDNLPVILERGGLHSPNQSPVDGPAYRTIHNVDIQHVRRVRAVPCGPGGVIHDYTAFYLGPRPPMLYQLHTGRVPGYTEGQEPLVYVLSTAQLIDESGTPYVFSNGHGIASFTDWFSDIAFFEQVDWETVYSNTWNDTIQGMDRQRRKQAEFLVHEFCHWELITGVAVRSQAARSRVEEVFSRFNLSMRRAVEVRPGWSPTMLSG